MLLVIFLQALLCICPGISGLAPPVDKVRFIVGGSDANISVHPHQVVIINARNLNPFCGGSIISPNWILTAAHCCHKQRKSDIRLQIGSSYHEEGGREHYVREMIYHSKYDPDVKDYDVCVIKTTKPIKYDENVQQISMVEENQSYSVGALATITGWGIRASPGKSFLSYPSERLQEIRVPVVAEEDCSRAYENLDNTQSVITERQICAGLPGQDACEGDSGGPMVIEGKLAGVVAWGGECGHPDFPGVYTNVATFRSWIKLHTGI